jgi:hypothetical protein
MDTYLIGVILSLFILSSSNENEVSVPSLTTTSITSVTNSTAISRGTIVNNSGNELFSRGICWNTL